MILEVDTAVKFLSDFLRSKNHGPTSASGGRQTIKREQVDEFGKLLRNTLLERFQGHWHPTHPLRGSGYRCIINQSINGKLDPVLLRTGRRAGIPEFLLRRFLPVEMALWIDPSDVAYRIGEQGSVCCLMAEKENDFASSTPSMATSKTDAFYHASSSARPRTPPEKQRQQHPFQQPGFVAGRRYRISSTDVADDATNPVVSDDSGIELSPASSPRPTGLVAANDAISNSSSPASSPLASPLREQPPSSLVSCKEQFQSRATLSRLRDSSLVSPSTVGVVASLPPSSAASLGPHGPIAHAPLTSFVR